MPSEHVHIPARRVPYANRRVLRCDCQEPIVGRKIDAVDTVLESFEGAFESHRSCVPDANSTVVGSGGKTATVMGKAHVVARLRTLERHPGRIHSVAVRRSKRPPLRHTPHYNTRVVT